MFCNIYKWLEEILLILKEIVICFLFLSKSGYYNKEWDVIVFVEKWKY